MLGHCDAKYDTALRVSLASDFKRQWHGWHSAQTATRTATCTFATCTGTTAGGTGATTGSTMISTATTPLRFPQLTSLLAPHLAGLSFSELTNPATEHLTDLFHFQ
jgi:hypothetical protein